MKTDTPATGYRVQDSGGLWATPCNPVSNWLLHVIADSPAPGQADLYFKPYRSAPDGTMYTITIEYGDGTKKTVAVAGTQVQP